MDADGNQVLFAIKKGTDSTVFWKGTIRIAVIRKNIQSSALETSKLLNLSQFLKVSCPLHVLLQLDHAPITTGPCSNMTSFHTLGAISV